MIYCNALMMGQSEAERRALMESTSSREPATCTSLLREDYIVFLSGVVARRDLIMEAGLFDERFVHGEDFDLWTRMLKRGARMGFQPRVLLNRRLHADSLSSDSLTHSQKALLVVEKFQARTDLTAAEREAVQWRIRSLNAEAGKGETGDGKGRLRRRVPGVEGCQRLPSELETHRCSFAAAFLAQHDRANQRRQGTASCGEITCNRGAIVTRRGSHEGRVLRAWPGLTVPNRVVPEGAPTSEPKTAGHPHGGSRAVSSLAALVSRRG
jgi:hypothetical protein